MDHFTRSFKEPAPRFLTCFSWKQNPFPACIPTLNVDSANSSAQEGATNSALLLDSHGGKVPEYLILLEKEQEQPPAPMDQYIPLSSMYEEMENIYSIIHTILSTPALGCAESKSLSIPAKIEIQLWGTTH